MAGRNSDCFAHRPHNDQNVAPDSFAHRTPEPKASGSYPDAPSKTGPGPKRKVKALADRFWAKVNKDGPVHPELGTKCWLWVGGARPAGYGIVNVWQNGYRRCCGTNIAAWFLAHGEWPGDLLVMHKCDNPRCVNPDHLELGTSKDNSEDMVRKGRACFGEKQGRHKLTKEDALEILSLKGKGIMVKDIAKAKGVALRTVWRVWRGECWGEVTGVPNLNLLSPEGVDLRFKPAPHGSSVAYRRLGCRCELCTTEHRKRVRQYLLRSKSRPSATDNGAAR